MTLSVAIITRNEQAAIRRCLESVAWADEIVVLDSASDDGTAAIARELHARVEITADWPGFGPQKNRALDRVTCDWVLSLDADEWVTPGLRAAIVPGPAHNAGVPADEHAQGAPARTGWARLLRRVFDSDLEHSPQCGGELKIIAAIEEPAVIVRILTHLGLPARAPPH